MPNMFMVCSLVEPLVHTTSSHHEWRAGHAHGQWSLRMAVLRMYLTLSASEVTCVSVLRFAALVHLGVPRVVLNASFCIASRILASLLVMLMRTGLEESIREFTKLYMLSG